MPLSSKSKQCIDNDEWLWSTFSMLNFLLSLIVLSSLFHSINDVGQLEIILACRVISFPYAVRILVSWLFIRQVVLFLYFTVYFVFDIVKKNWLHVFKVIQTLFFFAKESTSFPLETTTIRKLKEKFEQTGSVCDIQQRP